jgi:hypothetical protein
MLNRKKIIGIISCAAGVALARIDSFTCIKPDVLLYCKSAGILIALIGLAVFTSGLTLVTKKVKVCSECYSKNAIDAVICIKCRKTLL